MGSSNVTLRTLALGAQDATTGWYARSYTDSTISMPMIAQGTYNSALAIGYYGRYDYLGFTTDPCSEGDEIKDPANRYYQIKTVQYVHGVTPDTLAYYKCELEYDEFHADRPATSGTWISATDPASRVKTWIDTSLTAANMKEDDNATNATTLVAFGLPDYPISKVFIGKSVDMVFSIERSRSTALIGCDKIAYGYHEETPIKIYAIDKTGLTARRLVWTGEHEVRRIAELTTGAGAIGTGSVRTFANSKEEFVSLGSTMLYCLPVTIDWVRDTT